MGVRVQPGGQNIAMPVALSGRARRTRRVGQLFIALSVIAALVIGYEFLWTDYQSGKASKNAVKQLERAWQSGGLTPADRPSRAGLNLTPTTDVFAIIRIPRLGSSWQQPVIEGVESDDLARGVGHYPSTAMPGVIGNFAIAGHRVTHGHPFRELDQMRPGDLIGIQMRDVVYVYRALSLRVVKPDAVRVLAPVPFQPSAAPMKPMMIISTCNPKYSARERLILTAEMITSYPVNLAPKQLKAQ